MPKASAASRQSPASRTPRRRCLALREHLAGRLLEHDRVEPPRAIDAVVALDLDAARAPLGEREPGPGRADDDQVGDRAVGHVGLRAGELLAGRQRPLLGLPDAVHLAEGHGAQHLARGEPRQPALLLLFASGELQRQAGQRVPEERAGHAAVGDRLRREREVDHLEPGAAVLLRHLQAGHPHLREPLPERRVVALLTVEDLAQAREGALVLDVLTDRFLQQLLLFRDVEVHWPELLFA